jgi:Ca2+-binding EF-hand superfamily protein
MERQPRLERHNSYETMRGTVSFDSIVTNVAQQIADKGETIEKRFEWLASAIDTDDNGSISYAEFIKRRSILSLSMEEMGKLWQPLPKDAGGEVTVTDFTAALEACVPEGTEDLWVLAGSGTTQPLI